MASLTPPFNELTAVALADSSGSVVVSHVSEDDPGHLALAIIDRLNQIRQDTMEDMPIHVYHIGLEYPWSVLLDNARRHKLGNGPMAPSPRLTYNYGEDAPQFFDLMDLAYPAAGRNALTSPAPQELFPGFVLPPEVRWPAEAAVLYTVHVAKQLGLWDGA